jgi:hypothetical protein
MVLVAEEMTWHQMIYHNSLQEARNGGHPCGGWTKQAALAKVVGCFTGVRMNKADAEFIGNSHDARLAQFASQLHKARSSDRREVYVARKKGKEASHRRSSHRHASTATPAIVAPVIAAPVQCTSRASASHLPRICLAFASASHPLSFLPLLPALPPYTPSPTSLPFMPPLFPPPLSPHHHHPRNHHPAIAPTAHTATTRATTSSAATATTATNCQPATTDAAVAASATVAADCY